jgi:hypothetical protein
VAAPTGLMARSAPLLCGSMQRIVTKARNPMIISPPRLTWSILLGLVGFLAGGGCAPAHAQQFSADLVTIHVDGTAVASHLRVFNNKVRIETPNFPDGFFLIDGVSRTAYFARPGERVFTDARQSSRLTRLFVPVDLGDPCLQWQDMAMLAGVNDRSDSWRCERVGEALLDGRGVVVYRAISSPGRDILGWIDPSLKFPLRIRMPDGTTITAENIHEEPQPAQLFEIPSGLRKFDPEALIKRIKQSDVWVDAPPP